jgi:putative Mg2+ transporter-C (MgtC) family protein
MMRIEWFTANTLPQVGMLALALVLSATVGFERRHRLKSAGMRTHTLVGLGSAVFTLVGIYGFHQLHDTVNIDPSRVAAQIVSGIGFLGAGLIFVQRGRVSGLTTAASVWITAAIGMACGAGMPLFAIIATVLELVAVTSLGWVNRRLDGISSTTDLLITYRAGVGTLRLALFAMTEKHVSATVVGTETIDRGSKTPDFVTHLSLHQSSGEVTPLIEQITHLPGIKSVELINTNDT